MRGIVLAAIIFAATSPVYGQNYFIDGNNLHAGCQSSKYGSAMSYVVGVLDGMELAAFLGNNNRLFCPPGAITQGQAVDLVCNRLQQYPAYRHLNAATHVSAAMVEAYPCL